MNSFGAISNHLRDDVPINLNRMKCQPPMALHRHEFHELVIITRGQAVHFTDFEEYTIRTGDVFLIKPNMQHGYKKTADLELTNIFYLPERISLPQEDLREMPGYHALFELEPQIRQQHGFQSRLRLNMEELSVAEKLVNAIESDLRKETPGYRFLVYSQFIQLLFHFSQCYQKSGSKQSLLLVRLGNTINYIEKHYREPLSLEQLARRSGLSKRSLIRHFKAVLNQTPIEYLIRVRVSRASRLLTNSNLTIGEISEQTGFRDSNYFSRLFKQVTGLTPRDYRKSQDR